MSTLAAIVWEEVLCNIVRNWFIFIFTRILCVVMDTHKTYFPF